MEKSIEEHMEAINELAKRILDSRSEADYTPKYAIYETDEYSILEAELPGLTLADITLDYKNVERMLIVKGATSIDRHNVIPRLCKRQFGNFCVRIRLQSYHDLEKVVRRLENGLLTIHIGKKK